MPSISPEAIKRKRERHALYQQTYREQTAYHDREQRRNQRRHHSTWTLHPDVCEQVACDGEDLDDNGTYSQWGLYSPTLGHHEIVNHEGVTLFDTVSHLLKARTQVKRRTGKRIYPAYFSGGYDLDQQVAQSPIPHNLKMQISKQRSRSYGAVRGPDYEREVFIPGWDWCVYIGRKQHEVSQPIMGPGGTFLRTPEGRTRRHWTMRTADIYSLFNRSFIKAIKMLPDLPERLHDALQLVEAGKPLRGKFREAGWSDAKIRDYNHAELELQQWAQEQIIEMCLSLGLTPRAINSPAAISRALITKYGCGAHIKPKDYDTVEYQKAPWMRALRGGFFGGHIELDRIRELNSYWVYDLTSAYPDAIRRLPCCAHGRWRRCSKAEIREFNRTGIVPEWGIYRVQWRMHDGTRWGPFPFRDGKGSIGFPLRGIGWYHSPEIRAAIECGTPQDRLTFYDGWIWEPTCGQECPFKQMIEETFATRQAMLLAHDPREYILKLALNSLYGVMAQVAGSYVKKDADGQIIKYKHPKFSNLFAAGFITSYVRASVYRMLQSSPDTFLTATDAVSSITRIPGEYTSEECKELGKYTELQVNEPTIFLQPGVAPRADGKDKSRGFPHIENFYERVKSALENGEETLTFISNQYQDMRLSDEGDHFRPDRGKFIPKPREINLTMTALYTKRMPDGMPWLGVDKESALYNRPYETSEERNWRDSELWE